MRHPVFVYRPGPAVRPQCPRHYHKQSKSSETVRTIHTQRQSWNCGVPPSICIPPRAGGPPTVPTVLPQQTTLIRQRAAPPMQVNLRGFSLHWCGAARCVMTWLNETTTTRNLFFMCARYSVKHPGLNPNIPHPVQTKPTEVRTESAEHCPDMTTETSQYILSGPTGTRGKATGYRPSVPPAQYPISALWPPTTNHRRTSAEASDRERPRSATAWYRNASRANQHVRCHLNAQTTVLPKRPETDKGTNLI